MTKTHAPFILKGKTGRKGKPGKIHVVMMATNGKILNSTETFTRTENAINNIKSTLAVLGVPFDQALIKDEIIRLTK
jgi:hypothetical protein